MINNHRNVARPTLVRRRIFAGIRIIQVTLAALGFMTLMLALMKPLYSGSMQRALYFIAWSSPASFHADIASPGSRDTMTGCAFVGSLTCFR